MNFHPISRPWVWIPLRPHTHFHAICIRWGSSQKPRFLINWLIHQSWIDFVFYKIFRFIVFLIFANFHDQFTYCEKTPTASSLDRHERRWRDQIKLISLQKPRFSSIVSSYVLRETFSSLYFVVISSVPSLTRVRWAQVCHKLSTGRNGSRVTAALRHLIFPYLNVMLLRTINLWYKPYIIIHD